MAEGLRNLFWIFIFPGFVFTLCVGLVATWVVRKVSALVQWRVGPPLIQPFADVMKLMGKEILIPDQARRTLFIGAPLIGMAGVLLLSTVLLRSAMAGAEGAIGDVIVAVYLLVLPSLALILGSSASASPHAQIGTAREIKLLISYELPLLLSLIVVLIKSQGDISLSGLSEQAPVLSISGMIAFIVTILCVQAKLGFIPFDIAEAETELASGILMEYSGALLAVWKAMQAMMLVALPVFVTMVFLGGFDPWWAGVLKCVLVLVLAILIKNTNPRVRIDQAMKFFWVYCGLLLVIAVSLATIGRTLKLGWL
jgi:NADH-quinone oxidoreductase subunit H